MAIDTKSEERGLATLDGEFTIVRPLVTADQAVARWNEYQVLVKKIIGPTDIQSFIEDGKTRTFIKKQGWQKLATYHGIGIQMVSERLFHKHDPKTCLRAVMPDKYGEIADCGCNVVGARYVVRATAPNGRTVEGIGVATFNEKRVKYTRVEHDLAGKAWTRASNRAISAIIGAGEVSAEEARVAGEVAGLSVEQKNAISIAWKTANSAQRDRAEAWMHVNGFSGQNRKELFVDFGNRAEDDDVLALVRELNVDELPFDPGGVDAAEPLPTEGGRS